MAPPKKNHQNTGGSSKMEGETYVCEIEIDDDGTTCGHVVANNTHSRSSHNHHFHTESSRYKALQATREGGLDCREADCSHSTKNFNAMLRHMRTRHGFRGSSNPLRRHYNLPISTRRTRTDAAADLETQSEIQGNNNGRVPQPQLPLPESLEPTPPVPSLSDPLTSFHTLGPQTLFPTPGFQAPGSQPATGLQPATGYWVLPPYQAPLDPSPPTYFSDWSSGWDMSAAYPSTIPVTGAPSGYMPVGPSAVFPSAVFPLPSFHEAQPAPCLPLRADGGQEDDDVDQKEGGDSDEDAPGEPDDDYYIDPRLGR